MLPPFIIEQIRQREEKERIHREDSRRPRAELPLERYPAPRLPPETEEEREDKNRGVIILEL